MPLIINLVHLQREFTQLKVNENINIPATDKPPRCWEKPF